MYFRLCHQPVLLYNVLLREHEDSRCWLVPCVSTDRKVTVLRPLKKTRKVRGDINTNAAKKAIILECTKKP